VIASVGQRPHLRLLAVDGLPLAGKTTLADRLAAAIGGACVFLDDFIKPEREWRWRDRPSFPFDFIRHDEFVGAVRGLSTNGECRYRPWDHRTGERADLDRVVRLDGPVIVEGVTTLHPDLAPLYDLRIWVVLQLRLHEREPSAPVVGLSDGLVRPSPEGPVQDEGRRRRAAAGCQAGDQAADLGDAERHQELAGGSRAPFSLFRPARSPASRASASMARVTCRCQPRQLLTS
jgi:hypothetical protein